MSKLIMNVTARFKISTLPTVIGQTLLVGRSHRPQGHLYFEYAIEYNVFAKKTFSPGHK